MKNIMNKLFQIQQVVSGIKKEATNPFFNSQYFDINAMLKVLKPELHKRNMILLQPLDSVEGKPAIRTIIACIETGESFDFTTPIIELNDPQKAGGCITYFRRYALQSLFALEAEDDDANAASGKKPKAKAKPKPTMSF